MVSVANELKNVVIGYASNPQIFCEFWYTWAEQCVTLPRWKYCLEVWWAQWWSCARVWWFWWYSSWKINITQNTVAYIQVWWAWTTWTWVDWWYNGWWRGCSINNRSMTSWWWWTDIRLWTNDLYHRVIVAWWWWGWAETDYWCWTWLNWAGWWLNWINNCWNSDRRYWYWWTQTSWWGARTETNWDSSYITTCLVWKFWQWGWADGISTAYINWWGWGWYWGWAWWPDWWAWWGSWYIWSATSCSCHPNQSCMSWICYMTDWILCAWNTTFPSPSWWTETWHSWCWYAKISSV